MIGQLMGGKYRVVEKIGAGGMAEVYKAVQISGSHRTVAIKLLKSEYEQDAAFVRRFAQEAQAVLGLSHENIVRSYDVGVEGSMHYIVLEHVEGRTLKAIIQERGHMQPRSTVNLAAQVLDALAHAHERGIIHRDVKPQNIIVTSRGRAKLADFGIARNTAAGHTQTFSGSHVMGSVHYLSPEQAKGQPVTIESDLYSMGVMLYEMVTGTVPFEGDSPVTIALKQLQETPVPPVEINPQVPPALNDIILRAMQKDPALRYHSAKDMRKDLLRVLKEPAGQFARVVPAEKTAPAPASRRKRRRRSYGILRIALAALVVIGLFVVLLLSGQSIWNSNTGNQESDLVPRLMGKLLDEAIHTAALRGYEVAVMERVFSSEQPEDEVVSQIPAPGTQLAQGGVIQVSVSAGTGEVSYVPDFYDKTLVEAEEMLEEVGLVVGEIQSGTSELPAGKIFKQDPAPATMLYVGDPVRLFISGGLARSVEAPAVLGMPLDEALVICSNWDFTSLHVRMEEAPDVLPGTVLRQDPAEGEKADPAAALTLTVSTDQAAQRYGKEGQLTLDVPREGMRLVGFVEETSAGGIAYRRIVYEQSLEAGEAQTLTYTVTMDVQGEREVIFMLGETFLTRMRVRFGLL